MNTSELTVVQWIAALESGEYRKTHGYLKLIKSSGTHDDGDCCLGVALECVGVPYTVTSNSIARFDGYGSTGWNNTASYHDLCLADLGKAGSVLSDDGNIVRDEGTDYWRSTTDQRPLEKFTIHDAITRVNDAASTCEPVIEFLKYHLNPEAIIHFEW